MGKEITTIRQARSEDLETLLHFEQGVITYERAFTTSLKEDPITYYDLKHLMSSEDAQVLVAMVDDKIIGSGYALIKENLHYKINRKYAYLGFMYVLPSHRGKGINGLITDHLLEWSKNRGIKEAQLDVYAANESAIKAYEKKGFAPELLTMKLSIT